LKEEVVVIKIDKRENDLGKFIKISHFPAPREKVENENILHLVVYGVIKYQDRYLVLKRSVGGEKELKNTYALGVGEHVKPGETLIDALKRGIYEELGIKDIEINPLPIGIIQATKLPVDRRHLGVIFLCRLDNIANIRIQEEELKEVKFCTVKEIEELIESKSFNNWAIMVANNLILEK